VGYVVGIDIGGTTTKIVGIRNGDIKKPFTPFKVQATDPVTSAYGAFGRFISENSIPLSQIERVMFTGAGASRLQGGFFNLETEKVNEFQALGLGGLALSGYTEAIIVSMGTGTAFVRAADGCVQHIGGTGIGGGTLLGLSDRMLNLRNFDNIVETAESGNLEQIDLQIKDITSDRVSMLAPETTASNFGKLSDLAATSDIALGIINLVFQTIGMFAVFATRNDTIKKVVLTGNLTLIPQAKGILESLEKLYDISYLIPDNAEYATAFGAALAFFQ
jgi:type II pantothenate kinase